MSGSGTRALRRKLHLPSVTERRSDSIIERCHGLFKKHMPNAAQRVGLDKDDVARLTQSMRRESWQPKSICQKEIVKQYLDAFGSFRTTELERFGIRPLIAGRLARSLGATHAERHAAEGEYWGYWVLETK